MDARGLLDELLQSGKQLLGQGRDVAEEKLGVPESGEQRDAMVSGLGKGAIAGGILALLVGTKRGRSVSGKALKFGGMAAVAGVAYKAYCNWKSSQEQMESVGQAITSLDDESGSKRALLLVRAMIAAANADGHIDQQERAIIQQKLAELDLNDETIELLQSELVEPMSPAQLADHVDSIAAASEVYLLSSLVVDEANSDERDYLSRLSAALKLPVSLAEELETQAFASA